MQSNLPPSGGQPRPNSHGTAVVDSPHPDRLRHHWPHPASAGPGGGHGGLLWGGASQTLFGSRGSGNALTRATAILAALFFASSFALAVLAKNQARGGDDFDLSLPEVIEQYAPEVDDLPDRTSVV